MKFNISYPTNGTQKCIDIDDDKKCLPFFDRRMGQEIEADTLGEEFKGYIVKITGGNDKSGFPMKQGVLIKGRIKVLMGENHSCYRQRRSGEKKRKTVRGCIVGPDIRVLSVAIVKKGGQDVPGLTDVMKPRRLGPKRATRIKKLFGIELEKKDTAQETALIRQNVIRRTWQVGDKTRQKAPKIQRLITADRLQRKKIQKAEKRNRWTNSKKALEEYNKFLVEFKKQQARKHSDEVAKRKASAESKDNKKAPTQPVKTVKDVKKTDVKKAAATTTTTKAQVKPQDKETAAKKTTKK